MIGQAVVTITFWLLTVLCCGYATALGGRDGAHASGMTVIAVILSAGAEALHPSWGATNLPVMVVDCALLFGLGGLALHSRSFWPMWMTAAQLLAVVTHMASLLSASFNQKIYAGLESVWALPCLGSMVVGVTLDRRKRLGRRS